MASVRIVQTPEIDLRISVEDGIILLGGDLSVIEDQLRLALGLISDEHKNGNLMLTLKCRFPGCGRVFKNKHGLGTHEHRAHKGWNPEEERIVENAN